MPRFGVAFNRRKSTATADDFHNGQVVAPEQSSFRVIERTDPSVGKSFDGGARLARASGNIPKHTNLELEDNMFADLKGNNRGSGASNTTKTTSTDTSSRHSNASTAPSSADLAHDDPKHGFKKSLHDVPGRSGVKSSGSGFLNRAGRTFSFGQKKHGNSSPTKEDMIPDVPPIPTINTMPETFNGRSRGFTESTSSTATPPKLEGGGLDLGGDFGSMFASFDKRASTITLKNDGTVAPRSLTSPRPLQAPAPLKIEKPSRNEMSPTSWHSRNSDDNLLGSSAPTSPDRDIPPPVPRHQSSFKTSTRPSDIMEDEDAKLLQDSLVAGRLLSNPSNNYSSSSRFRKEEDTFTAFARKPVSSTFKRGDDNMFEGSLAHSSRIAYRFTSRAPSPPRNKVMTPAQFEKYRQDKERQGTVETTRKSISNDDDEDEINYDDDDDEIEKSKQQAKQRRRQEAHMAVYRQQMMKVTGEKPDADPSPRPTLPLSMSAPQLSQMKSPSPGLPPDLSDEDEDEEVPLAILQAHGFPGKNRPPTRLDNNPAASPNLRPSPQQPQQQLQPPRAPSALGDAPPSKVNQRHSMLPAFARNLPQDPFVGASIAKPAIRESIQFSGGMPASQSQQTLPPGGLVGVIANEERSRAMRRGSPNIDGQKLLAGMNGPQGSQFDPINGIPSHMMYNNSNMSMPNMAGMPGMQGMGMPQPPPQPPMLTVGDQAQLQMTQQMSQFMQMQMQFMQMMALNQNGATPQMQQMPQMGQMPPMQPPYGGLAATQSMNDLSSRHSMMGEPALEPPRRIDAGMRTMSMIQPSSASFIQPPPGYAGSIRGSGMGYAPSIAPSERSNVGLPGRYRPVSQAPNTLLNDPHRRTNTMSGALGNRWEETKAKPTINVVSRAGDNSDDDDEEGWEAMKAKREKKRTLWKSKKGFGSELSAMM